VGEEVGDVPDVGVLVPVPVGDPVSDPDGEVVVVVVEEEVVVVGDVEVLPVGGGTFWSPCPVVPGGRLKYWPVSGS
jgi:hypothetical protein